MDIASDDGMLEDVPLSDEVYENSKDSKDSSVESIRQRRVLRPAGQSKLMSILSPVSSPFSFRNRKKVVECALGADGEHQPNDLFVTPLSALDDGIKNNLSESESSGLTQSSDSSHSDEEQQGGAKGPKARLPQFFRPRILFKANSQMHSSCPNLKIADASSECHVAEFARERRRVVNLKSVSNYPKWQRALKGGERRSIEEVSFASGSLHGEDAEVIDLAPGERTSETKFAPEPQSRRRFVNLKSISKGYPKWQRAPKAAERWSIEEVSFASGSLHGEDAEVIDLASGERTSRESTNDQCASQGNPSQGSLSYLTMIEWTPCADLTTEMDLAMTAHHGQEAPAFFSA